MRPSTPMGITPPAPGLDREEPEFNASEDDIPSDDRGHASEGRDSRSGSGEPRERGKPERE